MSDAPRLTLTIRNVASLDNGMPTTLALDRQGAIIGRSPTADWSLPDPRAYISSRHCEVRFVPGGYTLTDTSSNGTYLNGSAERLPGPHILKNGDVFAVGHYEIAATVEAAAGAGGVADAAQPPRDWGGWDDHAPPPAQPAFDAPSGWDDAPPVPPAAGAGWAPPPSPAPVASGGWGAAPAAPPAMPAPAAPEPAAAGWGASPTPSAFAPSPAPAPAYAPPVSGASPWDMAPPPADPSSVWSSHGSGAAPAAEDAWGKLAGSYAVDWSRGGFEQPAPVTAGAHADQAAFVPPSIAAPPAPPPAPAAPPVTAPPRAIDAGERRQTPRRAQDLALEQFLTAAGLDRNMVKGQEAEVMGAAGNVLRRLVSGLVVMMEARARAKSQMGAQSTIFSRDGNNPIKFARAPEGALAQLLGPPLPGYMTADRAIEDSFRDLQLHQMATLKAMQGALRTTLSRFSPDAIRSRAESKGVLKRIMPGARDAELWRTYEREFSGVAQGSDEAFMDVFAKEFRKAYEEQAAKLQ